MPQGVKLQTCAFIFKKKYTGFTVRYKVRLIVHGYRQQYGIDYWETYAPVSSSRSIRILLTLAASKRMIIHQIDIETAFLNADISETIYLYPPDGLPGIEPGKVLLLKKSLYGLKQSPRNFNIELDSTICKIGFIRCMTDTCIYSHEIDGYEVYLSIYVDDIIIACSNTDVIEKVKSKIKEKYKISDMKEMDLPSALYSSIFHENIRSKSDMREYWVRNRNMWEYWVTFERIFGNICVCGGKKLKV